MDSISNRADSLATLLETRLQTWQKARDAQEQKLRDCYADEMRIARDGDTSGTGHAKSKKAKGVFVGVTRNKIRSAKARLNDSLFGNGRLPFDTEPTRQELREFSDAMEAIIEEQLLRGQFKTMLKSGVHRLCTFGTGFIFGPFVRTETLKETSIDTSAGFPQLVEMEYSFDLPYFESASPLDVFPDPDVDDPQKGAGVFWVSMESPHTVKAWADYPGFQNIDDAVKVLETKPDDHGSDQAKQLRGNIDFWRGDGRVKVARFFGLVPKSALQDDSALLAFMEGEQTDVVEQEEASEEQVEAIVIVAGGVVIKKDESSHTKRPVRKAVYEEAPGEMWGVGIAENNMPHQAIVNAGFRLFNEGKGMALLGTKAVDRSKFLPTEDFKKSPGKVYHFKPNLTPEEKQAAIIDFTDADVSSGWQEVIALSSQFSDDDTGITKYSQGDDASHLNKTATGISMIMSAASLPAKDVLQNIDEMWIEPAIEALIDWNIRYLEPETVNHLLGPDVAQKWQAIKQFGKASFMTWRATGAATFMQKEILANKLQGFMAVAGSTPAAARLNWDELITQVWDTMQMGREIPLAEEEGPQVPPELQMMIEQGKQMLQQQSQQIAELEAKLADKAEKNAIDWYKAETERADKVGLTPEQVMILARQTFIDMMQPGGPVIADDMGDMMAPDAGAQPFPFEPADDIEPFAIEQADLTPEPPMFPGELTDGA
jgi:hypothetical protein